MGEVIDYEHGISAIDAHYLRPRLNAVHLIVEGGRAAVIDTAHNSAAASVIGALAQKGLAPQDVDYVILTHIHLDHAGGAGLLMSMLPRAKLVCHPRGVRHLVDPRRLIEGTVAIYGAEAAAQLYGEVRPVPEQRILQAGHGASVSLNGRELRFLDTPGHARHHVCVVDARSRHVFAGDTFGLAYPELRSGGCAYAFPTTSPVQFDPPALHRSIDLLQSLRPEAIYVTHFSQVRDVPRLAADLHRLIDAHQRLAVDAAGAGPERHARLREGVIRIVLEEAHRQGWALPQDQLLSVFSNDIELNAQGLGVWLDSARRG